MTAESFNPTYWIVEKKHNLGYYDNVILGIKMETRVIKRNLFIIIYLALFVGLVFVVYAILKPNPTCNDGIKNQLEEGIDCGGPCKACEENFEIQDILIKKTELVDTATGKFDAVITVENPNSLFGASTVQYNLKYFDNKGQLLEETKWFKGYILPKQEKYLLVQEIEVPGNPTKVEVEIGDVIWKKFTADQENPRLEVILTEFSNSFQQDLSGFYRVKGTLVNESSLDLQAIKIMVVLRNNQGKLLATNSQVVSTVHSQEKRDFDIPFPSDYNMRDVTEVEIKPETDIFNSENYIKFFGIVEEEF